MNLRAFRASSLYVLIVVCVATFTDSLLYGLVIPVLPFALPERLGLDDDDVQKWNSILLGSYGLSIAIGSIFIGAIGDKTRTRRAPFVLGLILLALSTVLFLIARSTAVLLAARLLQGLSASVAGTVGCALLLDKVGIAHIAEAQGWRTVAMINGFLWGPAIGGILYDWAGYEMVFAPALALVGLEIVMRVLVVENPSGGEVSPGETGHDRSMAKPLVAERTRPPHAERAFGTGSGYGTFKTADLETEPDTVRSEAAVINGEMPFEQQHPASSLEPQKDLVNGFGDGGTENTAHRAGMHQKQKQKQQQHHALRFPFLVLLKVPRFSVAMVSIVVCNSFSAALEAVLPPYVRILFGLSPSLTSLIFIPLTIPVLFAPLAGRLVDRHGPRMPAALGLASGVPIFIGFSLIEHDDAAHLALMLAMLAAMGCMYTVAPPALSVQMLRAVHEFEKERPGVFGERGAFSLTNGLIGTTFAVGIVFGTFYGGVLQAMLGFRYMSLAMAALSLVHAVAVLCTFTSGTADREERRQDLE